MSCFSYDCINIFYQSVRKGATNKNNTSIVKNKQLFSKTKEKKIKFLVNIISLVSWCWFDYYFFYDQKQKNLKRFIFHIKNSCNKKRTKNKRTKTCLVDSNKIFDIKNYNQQKSRKKFGLKTNHHIFFDIKEFKNYKNKNKFLF